MMFTQSLDFKYCFPFGYILSLLYPCSLSDRLTASESVPYVMNARAQCRCGSISHSHRPGGARGPRTLRVCVCGWVCRCGFVTCMCVCSSEVVRTGYYARCVSDVLHTVPYQQKKVKRISVSVLLPVCLHPSVWGEPTTESVAASLLIITQCDDPSLTSPHPSCLPTSQVLPPQLNVSLLCVLASNPLATLRGRALGLLSFIATVRLLIKHLLNGVCASFSERYVEQKV